MPGNLQIPVIDITGMKFGSWTVGRYLGATKWDCTCSCGTRRSVNSNTLRRGKSKSCAFCVKSSRITHGESGTRLYTIWCGMKRRCLNQADAAYPRYGGRGVTVCKAWLVYPVFSQWAKDNGYEPHLTIDRKNNDLGYSPDNCRWATYAQQNLNRSSNSTVEYKGNVITIFELAKSVGMSPSTLRQRINRYGWGIEKAITTPNKKEICAQNVIIDGNPVPLISACVEAKMNYATVLKRLKRGWSAERALKR